MAASRTESERHQYFRQPIIPMRPAILYQIFAKRLLHDANHPFSLTVCSRVSRRCRSNNSSDIIGQLCCFRKPLATCIDPDPSWPPEAREKFPVQDRSNFSSRLAAKRVQLDPLSEAIHYYHDEGMAFSGRRQIGYQVHAPPFTSLAWLWARG